MVTIRTAVGADVGTLEELVAEAFRVYVPRLGQEPAPMTAAQIQLTVDSQIVAETLVQAV